MNEKNIQIVFDQFKQFDRQMRIAFIHKCLSEVGCMDIDNAKQALCLDRRTIYQQMKNKKVGEILIGRHKFPCIY